MSSRSASRTDDDARRALGRRPGPPPPKLQLEGSPFDQSTASSYSADRSPPSPRSRGLSIVIPPSPTISEPPASPTHAKRFRRPTISKGKRSPAQVEQPKGLVESRKLLSHLLDRLESRESAPDLLDLAYARASSAKWAGGRVKDKGTVGRLGQVMVAAAQSGIGVGQHPTSTSRGRAGYNAEDDNEEEETGLPTWDTESTFDLVDQTRGLLVLAHRQGLDLFSGTGFSGQLEDHLPVPVKPRRLGARLSSFASPVADKKSTFPEPPRISIGELAETSDKTLLERLFDVLQALMHQDSLHQIQRFRLSAPPKALQAATLDIASVVYSISDLDGKIRIVEMVIGTLSYMSPARTERICEWLEGRLGHLLDILEKERRNLSPNRHHQPLLSTLSLIHDAPQSCLKLSALVPATLIAVTSAIQSPNTSLSTAYRAHGIPSMLLKAKPDCALDLLQVIAFSSRSARRTAVSLLKTYFPRITGHNVIARQLPEITYAEYLKFAEQAPGPADHHENHTYIPWRISSSEPLPPIHHRCLTCEAEIRGFCVKCTLCTDIRHIQCLQSPEEMLTYDVIRMSTSNTKIAHVRYSRCLPRLDEKVLNGATARGNLDSTRRQIGQHDLHLVNLFSLTNCESCREPLWGTLAQAFVCTNGCQRFFHPTCVERLQNGANAACRPGQHIVIDDITNSTTSDPFRISGPTLQASSDRHLATFCLSGDELKGRSFDEVAVLYGHLWTQRKILETGLATGTLYIIGRDKSRSRSDPLGLGSFTRAYEDHLARSANTASPAAADFAQHNRASKPLAQGYLFSRHFLTYCTALIRSPPSSVMENHDLLNPFGNHLEEPDIENSGAAEMVTLHSIKTSLAQDLGIHDPTLVTILLNQLNALGLCTIDHRALVRDADVRDGDTWMSFGLPLLMDASSSIEILIAAIEVLLDDVDLSFNEQAFLILETRAWPSLLCSPYALERVTGAVTAWVMHEDHYLLQIVKKYASRNKPLPGVRETSSTGKGYQGTSDVPLYKEDRGRLLTQYASPWLKALHDQDRDLYARVVYDQSQRTKELQSPMHKLNDEDYALSIASHALDRLTAAAEAGILYSIHLDVTTAWLEDLSTLARKDHPFRALPRFIAAGHTWETEDAADIWSHCRALSSDPEDIERVCLMLREFAISGVEVPWELLSHIIGANVSTAISPSLEAVVDLIHAVANNTATIPADSYAELCCELFGQFSSATDTNRDDEIARASVGHALRLVLRAYGVSPDDLNNSALATDDKAKVQGSLNESKRIRLTLTPRQFDLSAGTVLRAAGLLRNTSYQSNQILEFLWLLTTKATLAANVDSFLYELGPELFQVLWPLFDSNAHSTGLMRLILRLLDVNAGQIEAFVAADLASDRHACEERLLTFALSLSAINDTNGSHSHSSAVGLILILLRSLIHPSSPTPDQLVILGSLLPTHLAALSRCFADHLARASDERRVAVLCDLQRFRIALPHWPVLSWSDLEGFLAEQVAAVSQMTSWRKSQPVSAMIDTQMVRSSLVALALEMLATGIEVPWGMAQRIQQHVAAACALPWPVPNEGIVSLVLPALRQVLDSSQRLSTGNHSKKTVLVGALFVPVIINFGNELRKHDYLTQKCLLDILMVTFYKQDVKVVELAALGTLQTVADFAALPGSTENRLLAIQILQTAVSRSDTHSFLRVSPSIFAVIAAAYMEQLIESGDSAIVEQCRSLLKTMIQSFGQLGLFIQVFKNDSMNQSWTHAKSQTSQALQTLILEETGTTILDTVFADLADLLKRDPSALQHVLASLAGFSKTLDSELSEAASENFGILLTRISKHIAEWDAGAFAPGSLLETCRYLLDRVPPGSVETLLHQSATILMLALSRFHTPFDQVEGLLSVSGRIASRDGIINTPQTVLYDALRSGLHHGDIPATSLLSILKCLTSTVLDTSPDPARERATIEASPGCLAVLNRHHLIPNTAMDPETTLALFEQATAVLIQAEQTQQGIIGLQIQALPEQSAQARCEMFTHLISATKHTTSISSLYPVIARSTSLCLRACGDFLSVPDTSGIGADMLSTAFNLTRLILLGSEIEPIGVFWARTWSDWPRLLSLSNEANCVNSPLKTVSHSVFLDLVIFLKTINSPLLTTCRESVIQALTQLEVHLQSASTNTAIAKLQKAKHSLFDSDDKATSADFAAIRKGIRADMLASEKIKALRMRR